MDGLSGEEGPDRTGTRKDLLGNELVLVVPATHPVHVDIGPEL